MRISWLSLNSFVLLALSGCAAVQFPDVKLCSVAGVMIAGADCDYSGHAEASSLGMQPFINWLEDEQALCMSSKDFAKQKTSVEQACTAMGDSCSFEVRRSIQEMSGRVDGIAAKARKNK